MLHKEGIQSKTNRIYLFGFVGIILIVSLIMNVVQYVDQSRVRYVSHINVNGTPAPDSIVWNGQTYRTDGERNPGSLNLRWLGVAKAGSEDINVFEVVGINPQTEIDYILGNRLVTASVTK